MQRYEVEDHPRPCGEKSSYVIHSADVSRITPAHAGKSPPWCSTRSWKRDHPRPCGEKVGSVRVVGVYAGSPPPMRGKGVGALRAVRVGGITPAHAGKSEKKYSF